MYLEDLPGGTHNKDGGRKRVRESPDMMLMMIPEVIKKYQCSFYVIFVSINIDKEMKPLILII